MSNNKTHYDYIIIGSGFGGSVSAMRLSEKGYKVLVIEKGKQYAEKDFPDTNWHLKRWLWVPALRFFGFFKLSFFRHITVLSGVGLGGGSLVYANTLPIPKKDFFEAKSWSHLANWEEELKPFYKLARKMLGVSKNPRMDKGDYVLRDIAKEFGKENDFELTDVGVFFGKPGEETNDPYFGGEGPTRSGCQFCGACMIGCKYNAKNTLDKNYLFFAKKNGAEILTETEVYDVIPHGKNGENGYTVKWKDSTKLFKRKGEFKTKGIIFAGGVLGTVPLLLKLKKSSLPNLSEKAGEKIRTNSESLLGITTTEKSDNFSEGLAISSILHTDDFSHVEPVRYPAGSGFWRIMMAPALIGKNWHTRLFKVISEIIFHPIKWIKLFLVKDWAKQSQILLFMQTLDSTLSLKRSIFGIKSKIKSGEKPTPFISEAHLIAKKFAEKVNGTPVALLTETIFGIPTTAHILGGATMGKDKNEGVINKNNEVFGYKNMLVCDGSMISANPGVNPSLTITALTERAMSKINKKVSD